MAQIFLSYARDDQARAERVAGALEAAGHDVWWDGRIDPGSRFSAEIAKALEAADVVLVLWSAASIDSPWVQDEAAFGRDHGRLVPALLGRVEPPLGFRQFQAVDLGKTGRKIDPLVQAIAAKLGKPKPQSRRSARPFFFAGRWRLAAGLAALLALAGLAWLVQSGGGGPSHVVAISAAEGGDPRRTSELARSIAADLGRFRAGPLGSLTVLGDEEGSGKADYRVEVGVAGAGSDLRADVRLIAPKGSAILWTASEQGAAATLVDVRQRIVAKLGDVLSCAVEAAKHSDKLSANVLSLHLNACGRMGDLYASAPDQEILNILRQLTEQAPKFAPGWANLALVESQSFPGTPPPEQPALRKKLIDHLARARRLGPDLPATIATVANFHPNDGAKAEHALKVIDAGLEKQPDSALLHDLRVMYLRNVGRLNEAVVAAQRAIALNPLSPAFRDSYITALAYSGRIDTAYRELAEAESIWPGSTVLGEARYRLDLRYGDPKAAMRLLRERGSGDLRPVPMDTAWQAFLEARLNPSPANVEKVLSDFRARFRRDAADVQGYLQALGTFGRVNEAYVVVESALALDSLLSSTGILFRQHMRRIRNDPRFIALAAKLGLLAYWEKTGIWPDFCSEPQLPYDCKAQAAKLTPEQRRIAPLVS